ncbi:MAG: trigger factor [Polyangiaceae bacterium]|nr:trigger factor [Polyangiaceae bacterium]
MQVTVQRISPVALELQVVVPANLVKAEVDKAYASLGKTARIKGFRPGKAPRDVLSRMFGTQVAGDVANVIVNDALPKALSEKSLTPVNKPSIEATREINPKEPFSFKARFEVQPDIGDVKFEGFELFRPRFEVDVQAVDVELENLRQRNAALKAPEPARPSQKGDVLSIDFTLSVDGKEIKDSGGQGVQIELGSGQALAELDAALIGKNVGDKAEAEHTFAAGHPREDFRNKQGHFFVTVTDVKERVPPAVDDEFAKDIGFDTLVALRADIHTKLEKVSKERAEVVVAEQIIQKLNDLNPCEVPPSLVEQQGRMMEQEIFANARRMGQRISKDQAANLHKAIVIDAERKVRAGLLMAAIAKSHEFRVTDEDLEKGLGELAVETGKNVAKLRAEYREKGKREMLIGMILEDKILDFIEAKATIVEGEPPAPTGTPKSEGEAPMNDEKKAEAPTGEANENDQVTPNEEKKEGVA